MSILLTAGLGTRLRPLTYNKPKALLSPAGNPMISELIAALGDDTVVVTGHGERSARAYVGEAHPGVTFVRQENQLGPGHALSQARGMKDEFLVLPGDAWYHPKLIERLQAAPCPAMIEVPDARSGRHGVPVIKNGKVTNLLEVDPAGDRAAGFCGGAYKMHRRIFDYLERCDFSMRDAIRMDIEENGPWHLVKAKSKEYVDVIEVEDLLKVHDLLMPDIAAAQDGTVHEDATVTGQVHVGEGSIIHAGAIVLGPVFIGKNCDIGPAAVLMPGTAIRNRVRIGPLTLLERCSLASNIVVGAHSHVRDAVIDNGASLGAFVQCEASSGIIIGADATIGDRVTVQAGAVVGRDAKVASGRTVKDVPDNALAV